MKRRDFLKTAGAAIAATPFFLNIDMIPAQQPVTGEYKNAIPRWRGFNLLDYFQAMGDRRANKVVREDDCNMIRDFGFDMEGVECPYCHANSAD